MKTTEQFYGRIILDIPHERGRAGCITYYILDSDAEIDGEVTRVYGIKAEKTNAGGKPESKTVINVSPSRGEAERLADMMLAGFVTLTFFEDVILDYIENKTLV